jgi:hypothetical protein
MFRVRLIVLFQKALAYDPQLSKNVYDFGHFDRGNIIIKPQNSLKVAGVLLKTFHFICNLGMGPIS